MDLNNSVVFFVGPTGAGKGTQAILLEEECGFKHLETSSIIEETFKEKEGEPEVKEAKKLWQAGELIPSTTISKWIANSLHQYIETSNVVLSGSPRTLPEVQFVLPLIEEKVPKENIFVIHLPISREESVKRDLGRRICVAKRHPIPSFGEYKVLTKCPRDGSDLVSRTLDKPEIINHRYDVYLNETFPIIEFMKSNGYKVMDIRGEDSIENVHQEILSHLKNVCHI